MPDAVNKVQVELLHNSSNFGLGLGLGPSGLDNSCRSFSCRRELLVPQLEKFLKIFSYQDAVFNLHYHLKKGQ